MSQFGTSVGQFRPEAGRKDKTRTGLSQPELLLQRKGGRCEDERDEVVAFVASEKVGWAGKLA